MTHYWLLYILASGSPVHQPYVTPTLEVCERQGSSIVNDVVKDTPSDPLKLSYRCYETGDTP